MKFARRFLPAVALAVVLVVGSMEIVSRAQSVDGSSLTSTSQPIRAQRPVTQAEFISAATNVCLGVDNSIEQAFANWQQEVQQASQSYPSNQNDPATTPLMGTTTTLGTIPEGSAGSSGSTSSTTTPSGSYDISPVQANPLAIVNQLLNQYMDQLDGIVGMQNDMLDELETLSEPTGDEQALQEMWVMMTQATIAQNQADVVLENIISDYYTAGFQSASATFNAQSLSISQAEQNQLDSHAFDQALLELTGGDSNGTPVTGSLESNLANIAGPTNSALGNYGLSACEKAGIAFQDYQNLLEPIPQLANDYLVTYQSQSSAGEAISLAQVLEGLPQWESLNQIFSGSVPASATASGGTAPPSLPATGNG